MIEVRLQPVDGVHLTTVMDNSCDVLLPDVGLVRRWGLAGSAGPLPVLPSELADDGSTWTCCGPSTASRR